MTDLVDLLFSPEHERAASNELFAYQKLQGANSMMWTTGDMGDGRKVVFDVPAGAVEHLRRHGVPCETRSRDPRRPLPV